MTVFSASNSEKKFHEVCNTVTYYLSCFLLPKVSTILENIVQIYPLHNLVW